MATLQSFGSQKLKSKKAVRKQGNDDFSDAFKTNMKRSNGKAPNPKSPRAGTTKAKSQKLGESDVTQQMNDGYVDELREETSFKNQAESGHSVPAREDLYSWYPDRYPPELSKPWIGDESLYSSIKGDRDGEKTAGTNDSGTNDSGTNDSHTIWNGLGILVEVDAKAVLYHTPYAPTISELKAEYVERLRSLRLQADVEIQLPSLEEASRPLSDPCISREDFVAMTEEILTKTSYFNKYRAEKPEIDDEIPDIISQETQSEHLKQRIEPKSQEQTLEGSSKNEQLFVNGDPVLNWRRSGTECSICDQEKFPNSDLLPGQLPSSPKSNGSRPFGKTTHKSRTVRFGYPLPEDDLLIQYRLRSLSRQLNLMNRLTNRLRSLSRQLDLMAGCKDFRPAIDIETEKKNVFEENPLLHLHHYHGIKLVDWETRKIMKRKLKVRSSEAHQVSTLQIALQEAFDINKQSVGLLVHDDEDMAINSQLIGRQKMFNWKAGSGRSKEWRQCRYIRLPTNRKKASQGHSMKNILLRRVKTIVDESLEPREYMLHPAVPAIALKSWDAQLFKHWKPKFVNIEVPDHSKQRTQGAKGGAKYFPVDIDPMFRAEIAVGVERRQQKKSFSLDIITPFQAYDLQSQTHIPEIQNTNFKGTNLPFKFHYTGEIINCPDGLLRLTNHLRSEPHGEVYAMEDLNSGLKYEVKVYVLRGIHLNQRKRRVENLKKVTASLPFLYSFNYNERKYCVFLPSEPAESTPMLKIGAIGRRNTREYNAAFPELPLHKFSIPVIREERFESGVVNAESIPCEPVLSNNQGLSEVDTLHLLRDKILGLQAEWQNLFSQQVLKESWVSTRLTEAKLSWEEETELLLKRSLSISNMNKSSPKRSRRGRQKRNNTTGMGDGLVES